MTEKKETTRIVRSERLCWVITKMKATTPAFLTPLLIW